jgi:AcrR family transcriptional regulator
LSPRSEESNRQIREQQRERIAAAAAKVFGRKGLAAARISDIAGEAGVSVGLVHHYFESKGALFSELIRNLMDAATQVPALAAKQPGTPLAKLRWYVEVMLAGMKQSPDSVMLVWQAQGGAVSEELRNLVRDRGQASIRQVAELIAAAQASGEALPGDPQLLALHLISLAQGLAAQMALGPVPEGYPSVELAMRLVSRQGGAA